MILQSEDKEEDTRLDTSLPQPTLEDLTPAAVATQSVPATIREEEEEIVVPIEELDNYFLSLSASSMSSLSLNICILFTSILMGLFA